MTLYPTLRTTEVLWTPAPPEKVRELLEDAVSSGTLTGSVRRDGVFTGQYHVPGMRNSWRPWLEIELSEASTGTLVEVHLRVNHFVAVFTLIHGTFLPLFAWVLGIGAFSWEVPKALAALNGVTHAEAMGWEEIEDHLNVADPSEPGAETQAPPTLKVRTELGSVRFGLPNLTVWMRGTTTLEVAPGALTLRPGGADERVISWQDFERAEVLDSKQLVLHVAGELLHIPATGSTVSALTWLATYLHTRAARFRASAEEAADFDEAQQRLRQLAGQRQAT